MKTIAIGCDHAGYELKEYLKERLLSHGYLVKDFGTDSREPVDYPDIIHPLASAVDKRLLDTAVIICGTGLGASIVANKYPGVRAALCWLPEIAILARKHNNANILSLPGRFISKEEAWEVVKVFLSTSFEGGRHERRVNKISPIL